MSKRVLLWIGAYVAAVAVFAGGLVLLARDHKTDVAAPTRGEQAEMPFPTAIDVGRPRVAVGDVATVSVGGTPTGGIATIDLYDGGRRVATVKPTPGQMVSQVSYPALAAGPRALSAAVTDRTGKVALTPVAPLDVAVAGAPVEPVLVRADTPPPIQPPTEAPAETPAETPTPPLTPAPTEPGSGATAGPGAKAAPLLVPVTVEKGETLSDVAARLGVKANQVQPPPSPPGQKPPSIGRQVKLPAGITVVVTVEPDAGLAELVKDKPILQRVPAAPNDSFSLAVATRGCAITLTPSNAPGGVDFFEAGPSGVGWTAVGSSRKGGAIDLRRTAPGNHVYMARSDDAQSTPAAVLLPFSCSKNAGWTGDARIDNGTLTVDPVAFAALPSTSHGMNLYLQADGGTAQKVQVDARASVDLTGMLPKLTGRTLDLRVAATGEMPVNLAHGSLRVPDGTTMADVIGFGDRASFELRDPKGAKGTSWNQLLRIATLSHDDLPLTFDWTSDAPDITNALWQVVRTDPLGFETTTILPAADALAGGISKGQPTTTGGSTGSFTLEPSKIPGHESVALRRQEVDQNAPITPEPTTPPPLATVTPAFQPAKLSALGRDSYAKLAPEPATGSAVPRSVPSLLPLPMPGSTLTVQVVLNPKGSAPGPWLPSFRVRLPTPQPVETATSGITFGPGTLEVDPGLAPDPGASRCGVVTVPDLQPPFVVRSEFGPPLTVEEQIAQSKADYLYYSVQAMHQKYPGGSGTWCMPPPNPPKSCNAAGIPLPKVACTIVEGAKDFLEALAESALGVYATISMAYTSAINVVVQLVSVANPLCIALKKADPDVGDGCVKGFAVAGQAAITVVLSYVGLPPALPSLGELKALAEGDLAELGRQIMGQFLPCDAITAGPEVQAAISTLAGAAGAPDAATAAADPCLALLKLMIAQTEKQIVAAWTAGVAEATTLPTFPQVPGFSIAVDPRTQPVLPTIRYHASPAKFDAQAMGVQCSVVATQTPAVNIYPRSMPLTEDDPVDGAGPFSGGGKVPFDFDRPADGLPGKTFTVDAFVAGKCSGGKATATATVPNLPR